MSKFNSSLSQKEQVNAVKNTAKPVRGTLIITGGWFFLFAFAASISLGAADINLSTIWNALFNFNESLTQHQIIWELRFPRIIGAAIVGAAFSVAGALMQGMTRNPLADSGLLGLNAGAVMISNQFSFFQACLMSMLSCCHFRCSIGCRYCIRYRLDEQKPCPTSGARRCCCNGVINGSC